MTEQPTALRLADAQDCVTDDNCGWCPPCSVAAELRRLYASCEDYAQHKQRQDQRVLELAERVLELKAQRDALLEALKLARSIIGHPDDAHSQMIDAAIKAVEENT